MSYNSPEKIKHDLINQTFYRAVIQATADWIAAGRPEPANIHSLAKRKILGQ